MRKLLALAAVTMMSAAALADASFGVRGDVVGTNTYNDPGNVSQPGSNYMQAQYARLLLKGKISEQFDGKLTLDFLQTGINGLKVAEVDHHINDMFNIGFGRLQDAGIGGFEALRPFYDHWFYSQAYQANFPFGIQADVVLNPDHKLKFVLLNQGWTGTLAGTGGAISNSAANQSLSNAQTANTQAQTNYGYGVRYTGNFGAITGQASYHVDPTYTNKTNLNSYLSVGVKYMMSDIEASLDYFGDTFTGVGTANNDNATKNSIVLMGKYNMGMFTPRIKYESTTVQDVSSTYFAQNNTSATSIWGSYALPTSGAYQDVISRYDIGTDIKPGGDKDPFFYSVHYVGQTNTFSGGAISFSNKTITESAVYVSIIAINDILK